jgi:hypothetical protein
MLKRLGPIDVDCDAPSYMIVQACRQLVMQSPEDVRWCRMRHFLGVMAGKGWLYFGRGKCFGNQGRRRIRAVSVAKNCRS